MTEEFKNFLMALRRQYLGFVADIERLLGMQSKVCPHCKKSLRD